MEETPDGWTLDDVAGAAADPPRQNPERRPFGMNGVPARPDLGVAQFDELMGLTGTHPGPAEDPPEPRRGLWSRLFGRSE